MLYIYIDIGANIGNHVHYLKKFKATGFAFEPEYSNFSLLKANASDAFVCKQIALSNSCSSEKLISYKDSRGNGYLSSTFNNVVNNWGDEVDYQDVEVRTLDSFGIVNCNFVKIDVEGSELKVLQGAIQTLVQSNPVVLIEIHADDALSSLNFPYTRLDIDTFFFRIGYKHHLAIDLTNHIYVKI